MRKFNDRALLAALRSDFPAFVERAFQEIYPGAEFLSHESIDLLAAKLESVRLGACTRMIINMPPRHLKSFVASVALPAFILGHDPSASIICVSYAQDLADKFSRDCRAIIQSDWYQSLFKTRLSPIRQAASEFETTKFGVRKATSIGGVLTGRGADFIIIDDPIKPDDALSRALRESVNDWVGHTLFSRLNDKSKGRIILVMQRLHTGDLTGHLCGLGRWEHLCLPAIAKHDETHVIETPFGRSTWRRREGEALHPARESLETLAIIRETIGRANFAAQYLQDPAPDSGNLVDPRWFGRYTAQDKPRSFDAILLSCDTANKASELSDFSALSVWGSAQGNHYLLHMLRKKLAYPDLKRAVLQTALDFNVSAVLIEDRASGTQLIQELREAGAVGVEGCEPAGDKIMRLHAQTALIENGRVWIPDTAPWLDDFLHEVASFPNGRHDDQVDSMAQALAWFKKPCSARAWIDYLKSLGPSGLQPERKVKLLSPVRFGDVYLASAKRLPIPLDGIIEVDESDALPLIKTGWAKIEE